MEHESRFDPTQKTIQPCLLVNANIIDLNEMLSQFIRQKSVFDTKDTLKGILVALPQNNLKL